VSSREVDVSAGSRGRDYSARVLLVAKQYARGHGGQVGDGGGQVASPRGSSHFGAGTRVYRLALPTGRGPCCGSRRRT